MPSLARSKIVMRKWREKARGDVSLALVIVITQGAVTWVSPTVSNTAVAAATVVLAVTEFRNRRNNSTSSADHRGSGCHEPASNVALQHRRRQQRRHISSPRPMPALTEHHCCHNCRHSCE